MNNCFICWFITHILTKYTVQEAKSSVKITSGSVARSDLIPELKGYESFFGRNLLVFDGEILRQFSVVDISLSEIHFGRSLRRGVVRFIV
jgi:hypothetical protein